MPYFHSTPLIAACFLTAAGFGPQAIARDGGAPPASDLQMQTAAWEAWHAERVASLTAEDGWLTLIDLAFLEDGATTVGAGAGCDLRYENLAADRVGRVVKAGDSVRFEVEAAGVDSSPAVVTADGKAVESVQLIADDVGPPTVIRSGSVSMILVRRNGKLALRVRDNQSPVRLEFPGIERFPFDPAFRVAARVEQPPEGARIAVTNVLGYTVDEPLVATLVFDLQGKEYRLDATQGSASGYFVVFGDTTNGAGTHGGGRFLSVPVGEDGAAIIDFNRAYNPPCAFTEFSTCELPTEGNRLPIPVTAGERAPRARP